MQRLALEPDLANRSLYGAFEYARIYLGSGVESRIKSILLGITSLYPKTVLTVITSGCKSPIQTKRSRFIRDSTPLPRWMTMCTYSLWWILIQRDWYLYQGNLDYLKEQKSYLCDLLQLIMKELEKTDLKNSMMMKVAFLTGLHVRIRLLSMPVCKPW